MIDEIKKLLKTGKIIIGKETTLKKLKTKNLQKIFLAKNVSASVKADIAYYADLASVEVVTLDIPNDELGDLCKKPFAISILGVAK
ncbi:MAG: ribosomal L7Ae/L30e/S12e/Gadd45 family protein [Candidatus Nanoarchaeia archaeon]